MSDYATVADLKTALRITDTTDDLELSLAIQVASEMIDRATGTRFWRQRRQRHGATRRSPLGWWSLTTYPVR